MITEAIALCRVSTVEQRLTNHSLERQAANVLKASEQLHAPIIRTWSLDQSSRSGKNLRRKDLTEMLEFCKQNKRVKYLIVDEVDRFMRSINEFYYFEVRFQEVGVTVYYASQPELNSTDMSAKVIKLLQIMKAEMSNSERQGKTLSSLKSRVAAGYYPFPIHQGYRRGTTNGLHVPDGKRFELLQVAFRQVAAQKFTPAEALRRLNANGYKTPSGKELPLNKFMEILRDEYYCGIVHIKSWDDGLRNNNALHQKMITVDEHEIILDVLDHKRLKYVRKKHNPDFMLSSLFNCECTGKFVGLNQSNGKGGIFPKYRCRKCQWHSKRQTVHDRFSENLSSIKMLESKKSELLEKLEEVWREDQEDNLKHAQQLAEHLEKLKTEKNQLIRTLATSPELVNDIKESIENIKKDIVDVEKDLHEASKVEEDFVEFTDFALSYVNNWREEWWNLDREDMIRCKQLLFSDEIIYTRDEKVYTPKLSPLFRFVGNKKDPVFNPESLMARLEGVEPPT